MKQKVIVRVSVADEKSRKRAMKIVVAHSGVESAALQGQDKNQIEVIGDGIDSVVLTTLLRKKVGFAELVTVNPIPEKKEEPKKNEVTVQPPLVWTHYPYNGGPYCVDVGDNYPGKCSIM